MDLVHVLSVEREVCGEARVDLSGIRESTVTTSPPRSSHPHQAILILLRLRHRSKSEESTSKE